MGTGKLSCWLKAVILTSFYISYDNKEFLTLKQMDDNFQNVISFSNVIPYKCNTRMKPVQFNEYLVSTVNNDGLVA